MNIYYAKIRIDYVNKTGEKIIVSLKTFGQDEDNASKNVEMMVKKWPNIKNFTILKISSLPIYLTEYVVRGIVKFKRYPNKDLYFRLKAENKNEAKELFNLKTADWKEVVSREIIEVSVY